MLPWIVGILAILFSIGTLGVVQFLSILPPGNESKKLSSCKPGVATRLLVVLGSGGHTAEMLSMLRGLPTQRYTHRSYVVSSGDNFSVDRAKRFEAELASGVAADSSGSWDVVVIPRARRIHQPLYTTPWTSLICLWSCFKVLRQPSGSSPGPRVMYPNLIVTNGPGTGVIVVLASLILRFLSVPGTHGMMRTIYVESWARVKRLSLSGKLLLPFVNRFLVQWETLLPATGQKGEYIGVLID